MQYFNGKAISDGTGQALYRSAYTIAVLDQHFGKTYWRAIRQTSCPSAAMWAYNCERDALGYDANIAIVKPGEIVELEVVK